MHINLPSRPDPSGRSRSRAQLERHIPAYREYPTEHGNTAGYLRNCEAAVAYLSMWMKDIDKRLANVDEGLVTEFVEHRRFFAVQAKNYKTPSSLGVVVSSARPGEYYPRPDVETIDLINYFIYCINLSECCT